MDVEDLFPPPERLSPGRQERIRSVLLDEISPATRSGRSRHTRRRWRVLAAPAAAAAAVTAIAIVAAVMVPAGHPAGRTPARHSAAGRPTLAQILNAAATSVARQHPGKYWHFFINSTYAHVAVSGLGGNNFEDQWIARDGNNWASPVCKPRQSNYKLAMHLGGGTFFGLGNSPAPWTYDRVQNWPTNAAALKALIATYVHDEADQLDALTGLELLLPTPPGVRAAAWRALATYPGVQNRGAVKGGYAVFIPVKNPGPVTMVIDPATGLIVSQKWPYIGGEETQTTIVAQWTNHLPEVIPPNKNYCSTHHR
jgi:hypothetical protein